jgi:hypothetical protein
MLIVFNLFGWIFSRLRKANLITLLLTGFSWFVLGLFYGIGYCPLTDWHFMILEKLGNKNLPASYIKYIVDRLTGSNVNAQLTDILTVIFFLVALLTSALLNWKYFRSRRIKNSETF